MTTPNITTETYRVLIERVLNQYLWWDRTTGEYQGLWRTGEDDDQKVNPKPIIPKDDITASDRVSRLLRMRGKQRNTENFWRDRKGHYGHGVDNPKGSNCDDIEEPWEGIKRTLDLAWEKWTG